MSAMSRMRSRTQLARRSDDSGAVAVEFSILVPIAMLFIGFLIALGLRTLWAGLADDAARSLARYASIRTSSGNYPSRPAVITKSGTLLGGILGTPTVSLTQAQTGALSYNQDSSTTTGVGEGDVLTVTVTYDVPGISILADWVKRIPLIGFDLTGFTTVTETSSARRE